MFENHAHTLCQHASEMTGGPSSYFKLAPHLGFK
jgi:hypothetical protein